MQSINLKWTVGDVKIFQLIELEAGDIIQSVIPNAIPDKIKEISWLYPNFADSQGKLKALVQSFLIQSKDKNILIDTCNGNDKKRVDVPEWNCLKTTFLEQLSSLNLSVEDIDIVACTHLHMDHVGWNTTFINNRWVPTFPNARYLFDKKEYNYWITIPEKEIKDDHSAFEDSVIPIINSGQAELVDPWHKIDDNIQLIPTPGHTPSHVSIHINSEGQEAIISGDLLHHPCQIAFPNWETIADTIPALAIETRNNILSNIANTNTILIGSHFSNPVAGRIIKLKNGDLELNTQL